MVKNLLKSNAVLTSKSEIYANQWP